VIYVVLAAISVVVIILRLVLVPTACVSLSLFFAGCVVHRPWQSALTFPWPALNDELKPESAVVINGRPCPFQGYEQNLLVVIRPRKLQELLACVVLAGVALYVMIFVPVSWEGPSGPRMGVFEVELTLMVGLMVLLASLRWFGERRFLRSSRFTIGAILGRDPGFFRRGITYQFRDHQGDRRGGSGPLKGESVNDNAVLVLYNPREPDTNLPHGAFHFHRFDIGLLPGRRR